jgi:hypothetical protein
MAFKNHNIEAEIFFGPTNQRQHLFSSANGSKALMIKNVRDKMKKENPPN